MAHRCLAYECCPDSISGGGARRNQPVPPRTPQRRGSNIPKHKAELISQLACAPVFANVNDVLDLKIKAFLCSSVDFCVPPAGQISPRISFHWIYSSRVLSSICRDGGERRSRLLPGVKRRAGFSILLPAEQNRALRRWSAGSGWEAQWGEKVVNESRGPHQEVANQGGFR